MPMRPKLVFLHICRAMGVFRLARFASRRRLLVLCYHGFSIDDEHHFRPRLFVTAATLRRRLAYLRRKRFAVLPLEEALDRLQKGTQPPGSCAITIDDGFYSVKPIASPEFRQFGFPYTIYVTTYYCRNNNPIFRLAVQYLIWKSENETDLGSLDVPKAESGMQRDGSEIRGPTGAIIGYGERRLDESGRVDLASRLASQLGEDYDALRAARTLTLLNPAEVKELAESGVDIQLHTHTHRFPEDASTAKKELDDNKRVLSELASTPLRHFCYPSGRWSTKHAETLAESGIASATTCELGLAKQGTHPYQIPRILDGEHLTQVEFESAVCGFSDMLRWVKRALLPSSRQGPHS